MPGTRSDSENSVIKDLYKVNLRTKYDYKVMHPEIFTVVEGSAGAGEKETQLLGADQLILKESENQKIEFTSPEEGWQSLCKYDTYMRGLCLSKERIRDDVKNGNTILQKFAKTWTKRDMQKRETVCAQVFNNGSDLSGHDIFNGTHPGNTDSSGDTLFDGYPFFNLTGNARTSKGGVATYYNSVASLTLTPDNFETMWILATVTNAVDELDIIEDLDVDTLLTECGADDLMAQRILNSEYIPNRTTNDINPYYKRLEHRKWRYLNDSAFYVGKRQHEDFQFRVRQDPEIDYFEDKTNKTQNASYDTRFGVWILFAGFRIWNKAGGTYA